MYIYLRYSIIHSIIYVYKIQHICTVYVYIIYIWSWPALLILACTLAHVIQTTALLR